MDKNESSQELILDLLIQRGCEINIRPVRHAPTAISIDIRHNGKKINTTFETLCLDKETRERALCHTIKRVASELLGSEYRRTVRRNFKEE